MSSGAMQMSKKCARLDKTTFTLKTILLLDEQNHFTGKGSAEGMSHPAIRWYGQGSARAQQMPATPELGTCPA